MPPTIIVTGASGFIGRHFLEAAKEHFVIHALARRSQRMAGVPPHPNIRWAQVDIGNRAELSQLMREVTQQGGADYLLHLAAYYDFTNSDRPEYERTNVEGTRHVLEEARSLRLKHFVFASSITVTEFRRDHESVTEDAIANATFPYARSKRLGEELVQRHSDAFPCSVLRLAAVFSDWCEYPPLYHMLSTWLSTRWNARILAGRGESAVPYIHVEDVTDFLLGLFEQCTPPPRYTVHLVSPDDATSHRQLYEMATRFYFGAPRRPLLVPKALAGPGIALRHLLGRVSGKRPFERLWMLRYVDLQLTVDASRTRRRFGWAPRPRRHIQRRLLFLIEKIKGDPYVWHARNEAALERGVVRPNLVVFDGLAAIKDKVAAIVLDHIMSPEGRDRFPHYQAMGAEMVTLAVEVLAQLLAATVRTGDRVIMLDYMRDLARMRYEQGFDRHEMRAAFMAMRDAITTELRARPELRGMDDAIYDYVTLSTQLALDEIDDTFECLARNAPRTDGEAGRAPPPGVDAIDLVRRIARLHGHAGPQTRPEPAPPLP